MTRRAWAVGAALTLLVGIGAAAAVRQNTTNSPASGQVPMFEPDPLWTEALPNKWTTGAVGGVAVDKHDNVWVFHRPGTIPDGEKALAFDPPRAECCLPAPSLLEFSPDGRLLQAWGGPGQGYDWFASEHGVFIDQQDNVWLSGSAKQDNHILKLTTKGKLILQIGRPGQNRGSNDTENVGGPASLWVHPKTNELFVADGYFNHRVVVFDAETGKYKRHWGAYGKPPVDDYKFPPRAQLIVGPPASQFHNPVHGVLVTNDDLVYVADRTNNRLQVFRLDGTFIKEVFITRNTLQNEGTVYTFAVSPDPQQRFLYVVDGSNKAIRVLNRQTLEVVSSIGGHAGHNAREFFHVHSLAGADSKGNLYLGEVNDGMRYYKYRFTGMGPAVSTR
jgi:DNA-binding beta-propeller fold protein YncE